VSLDFKLLRDLLDEFKFADLFIKALGWNSCSTKIYQLEIENKKYEYQTIAEISGIFVFQVKADNYKIPSSQIRAAIYNQITGLENLIIFIDREQNQSLWYWVKNENNQTYIREHLYEKGQSGDSLLGKIASLFIDISRLENGEPSVAEIAEQLKQALDIEKVTKDFYKKFQAVRAKFLEFVEFQEKLINSQSLELDDIHNGDEKSWYTSVIINRLMFLYFLQRKCFINNDIWYLQTKLKESKNKGENLFYNFFLISYFLNHLQNQNQSEMILLKKLWEISSISMEDFFYHIL
jgi:hypothetical protein